MLGDVLGIICIFRIYFSPGGRENWTSDGCITNTSGTTFGQVQCQCTHLKNFAILVVSIYMQMCIFNG